MRLFLRNAEVDGRSCDVRVSDCHITLFEGRYLTGHDEEELEIDARGGALLPGLHDHHLHLLAMAAASVDCSTATTYAELGRLLRDAPGSWVRATGYHESIAGDLDRNALDRLVPDRPVRVQHRSGALWLLNSRALQEVADALDDSPDVELDASGRPNGRLWRYDSRLRRSLPPSEPDLAQVGDRLLRLGITGVTDATPDLEPGAIALLDRARTSGDLPQHVMLLGAPDDFVDSPTLTAGPAKLMLRDHDLPDVDEVAAWAQARHAVGRAVAVHCVTSDSLAITLAALDSVGTRPGDRIEHGAIIAPGLRDDVARLGVHVVTNPGFLHARGDTYCAEIPPQELPFLYPYRSLVDAGVPVAAASDAPYSDPDPWAAIRAAAQRTTAAGRVLSPEEAVAPATALAGYLSPATAPGTAPRPLRAGDRRGLCLLQCSRVEALSTLDADIVRLVAASGRIDSLET